MNAFNKSKHEERYSRLESRVPSVRLWSLGSSAPGWSPQTRQTWGKTAPVHVRPQEGVFLAAADQQVQGYPSNGCQLWGMEDDTQDFLKSIKPPGFPDLKTSPQWPGFPHLAQTCLDDLAKSCPTQEYGCKYWKCYKSNITFGMLRF